MITCSNLLKSKNSNSMTVCDCEECPTQNFLNLESLENFCEFEDKSLEKCLSNRSLWQVGIVLLNRNNPKMGSIKHDSV